MCASQGELSRSLASGASTDGRLVDMDSNVCHARLQRAALACVAYWSYSSRHSASQYRLALRRSGLPISL
jgi:hypothetical protein